MGDQINIEATPARRGDFWTRVNNIPRFWPVVISLVIGIGLLLGAWNEYVNIKKDVPRVKDDMEKMKEEMRNKVSQQEYKALEERVTRQYANQKADIDKVIKEFEPVKNWVEWRKGYDQALKDLKK